MSRHTPGERWYRRVLRLYPKDFRDEFGGEMTRLYRDRRNDERWWSLWCSLLVDLARTAPSEHLSMLRQDVRHSWRSLRRTPIVIATAVLTLALGIGASTAVFSVVRAVLLRPLPYPESDRLVELFEENLEVGSQLWRVSALNYLSWGERSKSFEAIAAFGSSGVTATDDRDPELLSASLVTASFFRVLRVAPIVGRPLRPEDEQPGSSRVVVLSESLWRSRFGADPDVVERSITLDGERYRIVGVMPRTFREVGRSQLAATADARVFLRWRSIGRRRTARTIRSASSAGCSVAYPSSRPATKCARCRQPWKQEFPASNTNWGVRIETLSDAMRDPQVHRSLFLVLGAVTMVFLIACANVANLMLARGTRRRAELAVRTALGAGRSRLVRQLLTESSCLAVVSGAAGVFVAAIAHPLVRALLPLHTATRR